MLAGRDLERFVYQVYYNTLNAFLGTKALKDPIIPLPDVKLTQPKRGMGYTQEPESIVTIDEKENIIYVFNKRISSPGLRDIACNLLFYFHRKTTSNDSIFTDLILKEKYANLGIISFYGEALVEACEDIVPEKDKELLEERDPPITLSLEDMTEIFPTGITHWVDNFASDYCNALIQTWYELRESSDYLLPAENIHNLIQDFEKFEECYAHLALVEDISYEQAYSIAAIMDHTLAELIKMKENQDEFMPRTKKTIVAEAIKKKNEFISRTAAVLDNPEFSKTLEKSKEHYIGKLAFTYGLEEAMRSQGPMKMPCPDHVHSMYWKTVLSMDPMDAVEKYINPLLRRVELLRMEEGTEH